MLKKHLKRPQTRPNICICLLDHVDEVLLPNIKIERQRRAAKLLISGRSGTQYVATVTKLVYFLVYSYCGVQVIESYCKESNMSYTNWLGYLFIIVDQNSAEFMTSSLD